MNLQADGSALYSAQGLWTQARENLDITTIILSNRKSAILLGALTHVGANPGRVALDMMSLENPSIGWIDLAKGYGVEAAQTATMERFAELLTMSFRRKGHSLLNLLFLSW